MNEVIQLFGKITVKDVIILCVAIYAIYELIEKLYKKITNYYSEELEEKSTKKQVEKNTAAIKEIKSELGDIKELIIKESERQKKYQTQSLQDKIFVCYNNAKKQGFITRSQLENFAKNVEEYEKLSMNGLVHEKYKPEVYKMEVRED